MTRHDIKTKKDYQKCLPYFRRFVQKGFLGCPEIAEKTGINYSRVLMLFSIFIKEYSATKIKNKLPNEKRQWNIKTF